MNGTATIQNPALKTPSAAANQWAEYAGGYIVATTWLTGGLCAALLLNVVLAWSLVQTQRHYADWKPLVLREYADGRVAVTSYDEATFRATDALVRHFLTRFVELHLTRQSRTALERDYTNSLLFLEPRLQRSPISPDASPELVQQYLRDRTAKEVEVVGRKVTLIDTRTVGDRIVGGQASIDFVKVLIEPTNTNSRTTRTFTAQVRFDVLPSVPNHFIPVNPIGLQITSIHIDEQFN